MPERAAAPVQLTDRDIEILRWLARFRGVTAAQVGRRFEMGYSRVSRRLNQLGAGGYVALERVLHRRPGLYIVTEEGQVVGGADLPVATVALGTYEHDVALADVAIGAELAGERVVTQRQMQALEVGVGARDPIYAVEFAAGERHFPDLMLERADGRWALEVEVTDARSELLETILRAYAGADHLAGVIYHVAPAVHADRIERAAAALALASRFELHVLEAPID
jgi:DNA-binding transcriptional ArsR family regulator